MITGNKIVRSLKIPRPGSHKGDNGRLLVIAGSEKYHGSLLYAIKIASRIVDLIYVLTTKDNQKLVRKLKNKIAEFIPVSDFSSPFPRQRIKMDCVLIGPGMGVSAHSKKLVEKVLLSRVRAVFDADALNVMDTRLKKFLGSNHIVTPHAREFAQLASPSPLSPPTGGEGKPARFESPARNDNLSGWRSESGGGGGRWALERFVKKYPCTVVLKGKVDIVASTDAKIYYNHTGNQGMTKGGTGDVLAGLIAAFYCRNDAFTSAAAGAYLNGLAGDQLFKKVGPFYNAEDLINQIPKTLWNLVKSQ